VILLVYFSIEHKNYLSRPQKFVTFTSMAEV
jgi:hypothetical protein